MPTAKTFKPIIADPKNLLPAPQPMIIGRAGLYALGVPFSNAHLLKLEAAGKFPKRLTLGARACFWMLDEVRIFISERARPQARDASLVARRKAAQPGTHSSVAARTARASESDAAA